MTCIRCKHEARKRFGTLWTPQDSEMALPKVQNYFFYSSTQDRHQTELGQHRKSWIAENAGELIQEASIAAHSGSHWDFSSQSPGARHHRLPTRLL